MRFAEVKAKAGIAALALGAMLAVGPSAALASGGGVMPISGPTETTTACTPEAGGVPNSTTCPAVRKARLVEGAAIPPATTPPAVLSAIAAANTIRTRPYIWGGGHTRWWDRGYDCSGSVSFALHGGGLLETPLDSGEMMRWGAPGRGRWITVYANAGHAFAVIEGLRWDTAGDARGTGPRWHTSMVSTAGYVARHPLGY